MSDKKPVKKGEPDHSNGFDHQVVKKDPQSGQEIARNDYALHLKKNAEGHTEAQYEQPIGSGKMFYPDGKRIEILGDMQKEVAINAEGQSEDEFNKANSSQEAAHKAKK